MRKKHCSRCLKIFNSDQLYNDLCYNCLYCNNVFPAITVSETKFDRIDSFPFILVKDTIEELAPRISVGKKVMINSSETNRIQVKRVRAIERISQRQAAKHGSDGDRTVIFVVDLLAEE